MNARMLVSRRVAWAALVAIGSLVQLGCSKSDIQPEPERAAYLASGGLTEGRSLQPSPQATSGSQSSDMIASQESVPGVFDASVNRAASAGPATDRPSIEGEQTLSSNTEDKPAPAQPAPLPQLGPDLPPTKLLEVLDSTDKDMQLIVTGRSGITDPQQARDTLIHFMKMKLEASRRLLAHPDSNSNAKSVGARGELQSLSHLAAVGDLKAAQELEKLAIANMETDDPRLVADSRLVLMGFAIESLQNGKEGAADQIISYVDAIKKSELEPDIPAMMVMGQAREALARYGHDEQASIVRESIIALFGNSPDPQIAELAGQLAGNVRFDAIEGLRAQAVNGDAVPISQWREAVATLIDESADMQTVKYLAGAALEFESRGLDELVRATFDIATQRFDDEDSATGREVRLAVRANQARADVIGRVFDPEPTAGAESELRLTDYRGKVVLIPFWAMGFPESLQLITRLKSIQDADPENTAIVGLNLDAADAPVEQFVEEHDFNFPSIRARSSATEIATRFGLVSFPFVAILDQKGHVAAINFTGYELENTVKKLLQQ